MGPHPRNSGGSDVVKKIADNIEPRPNGWIIWTARVLKSYQKRFSEIDLLKALPYTSLEEVHITLFRFFKFLQASSIFKVPTTLEAFTSSA